MAGKSLLVLLLLFSLAVHADVINPGEIKKEFTFTNLDQFPGYTYYYLHHGYHYDKGWHAEPLDTALVENNKRYTVSLKDNAGSYLMALAMANSNNSYALSSEKVGGGTTVDPSIRGIVEVFSISGIDKGIISIKKEKEIIQFADGKIEERKTGGSWMMLPRHDNYLKGLALTSFAALLLLFILYRVKNSKPKYIIGAT